MNASCNKKERLARAFALELPDRPPIMGGWLAAPGHIQTLTGCSEDAYWTDPFHWGLEAERVLGSDGVIGIFKPLVRGGYRCVDGGTLEARAAHSVESLLAHIDTLPDAEELWARFDFEAEYRQLVGELEARQSQCGDILWCPADWELIPQALWYHRFGYETTFTALALYPERYRRLIQASAIRGRQRAMLRARAIWEGLHPRAILTGEDLCAQKGPMVSPAFLRREYFPLLEYALEPLVSLGARVVWHCDGNCQPLLDDVLACGVAGLQGFQRECGMDLEWIVKRRTRRGERLLLFGPLAVTTTLPHGTPDEVRAEVRRAMELCRDNASLAFFVSNTINPDVPLANVRAYWEAVRESAW